MRRHDLPPSGHPHPRLGLETAQRIVDLGGGEAVGGGKRDDFAPEDGSGLGLPRFRVDRQADSRLQERLRPRPYGRLDDRDCALTYWQGSRRLAVVTIGRDSTSLQAELEMERAAA